MLGICQQVYKVRHRVWSCHSQDSVAATTHHRTTPPADVTTVPSTDYSVERQEKLEENDRENSDHELWNENQDDGW